MIGNNCSSLDPTRSCYPCNQDPNGFQNTFRANRMMYSGAEDLESFISGEQVVKVSMPTVSSRRASEDTEENNTLVADPATEKPDISNSLREDLCSAQLTPGLVTLAMLPKTQWQSLVNLDIIKMRNKPIEQPKKPEKAPFYLQSLPALSGERIFVPNSVNDCDDQNETVNNKRVAQSGNKYGWEGYSAFMQLLHSCMETKDFAPVTDYLKSMSPSAVDLELRMLQIIDNENITESEHAIELKGIGMLLDYFINEVVCNNNFEFVQALIRLFLK
ncbi:hypothetical protein KI387_012239, partial [Taxus chinensis]